jgi:hypothetical protein
LIVALALGSIVMAGLTMLGMPMIQGQAKALNVMRSQGDAMMAQKALGLSLRESSQVDIPPYPGTTSALSGCVNFDAALGGVINPAQPIRAFYFCEQNGDLHYYQAGTCPITPPASCAAGGAVLAKHVSGLSFVRVAGRRNVVEFHYTVTYSGGVQVTNATSINGLVSFQSASEARASAAD